MVTNRELNDRREPGCSVVLADKKYFHVGDWFMKRTLRQHEWQSVSDKIVIVPPTTYPQRWKTDAAILRFLRKETNIPLPPAECTFKDDGAFYFQSQFVDGVSMKELAQEEKEVVTKELERCWRPMRKKGEYVFCHNDLGQHNVIVDPETLKIQAIIDWEFGGFWPAWFERPFWKRPGPSVAVEGEEDDVQRCRDWLMSHCDEVEIPIGGKEPRSGKGCP
ncbi:hypothetical protein J3458_021903 [Metarhizium acridum]|uniref:uncharacterized protein n=1 Tax=Metarhizium acridum TaxID=92637 RepID=UPI001C6CE2FD|nr:hypothetical protein J3458_021903 [Metarhizium acridum]